MRTSAYSLQTSGRLITLPLNRSFTVGRRAPDLSVSDDRTMSRTQCRFIHHQGLLFVEDLGATNPTLLNGRALTARSPAPVNAGDSILAGSTLIEISRRPPPPPQPPIVARRFQDPLVHLPQQTSFFNRLTLAAMRLLLVVVIAATATIQIQSHNQRVSNAVPAATQNDAQRAQSFFEGALNSSEEFQTLTAGERQELLACISNQMLKPFARFDSMIDAFNQDNAASQQKMQSAFSECSNHHLDSETK